MIVRLNGETHAAVEKQGAMRCTAEGNEDVVLFIKPGGILMGDLYIHAVVSLEHDVCQGHA